MEKEFQFSLYLDTRRAKKDGTYPVKLQLYIPNPKKQKYYPTVFSFTKEDFEKYYLKSYERTPKGVDEIKQKLNAVITHTKQTAEEIQPFEIERFEKRLFVKKAMLERVSFYYSTTIEEFKKQGRINTASNYELSLKSFEKYLEHLNKTKAGKQTSIEKLTFLDIDKKWLEGYEKFMLKEGKSISTVGIYLRPLRAIFNKAKEEKIVHESFYPFGATKYKIPSTKNNKRALSQAELKSLFNAEPLRPQQEKAKDFWFFSYSSNGMNVKDIALLKYEDIKANYFEFLRAKTQFTSKEKLVKIKVYLNDFNKSIIEKYGNEKKPENYVFGIISPTDSPETQRAKIQNFTRFINQNIKALCKANELPEISTYWARHSFATLGMRKGASMEFMQESLGHKDMKTTQNYFSGFDDETKQEFASKLMDFD